MIVLGKIAPAGAKRDAVHTAVIPVKCRDGAYPGEKVTIVDLKTDPITVISALGEQYDGVIDPFLPTYEGDGWTYSNNDVVYMLVHPERVADGVRHDFELKTTLANDLEPEDTFCCAGQRNERYYEGL